jgi:hypothetical protein
MGCWAAFRGAFVRLRVNVRKARRARENLERRAAQLARRAEGVAFNMQQARREYHAARTEDERIKARIEYDTHKASLKPLYEQIRTLQHQGATIVLVTEMADTSMVVHEASRVISSVMTPDVADRNVESRDLMRTTGFNLSQAEAALSELTRAGPPHGALFEYDTDTLDDNRWEDDCFYDARDANDDETTESESSQLMVTRQAARA